jgi:transcriptional regulator with XRE-family HTH domain
VNEEAIMGARELGEKLRQVRDAKNLSLAAVAGPSGISPTYLQKLERGEVEAPSPHRLYSLAATLDISYTDLMELAGYLMPSPGAADPARERANVLLQALSSDGGLTEEEITDVAAYLAFKRQQANRSSR